MTNITVLVVEDNPPVAKALGECVNGAGCAVLQATDVGVALRQIDHADILFLDWRLEGGEGGPVLTEWVARRRGPVVIMTGVLNWREREQLLIAGANHAIQKPISAELVLTLLRRYCLEIGARRRTARLDEKIEELCVANKKLRRGLIIVSAIALVGAGPQAGELIRLVMGLF